MTGTPSLVELFVAPIARAGLDYMITGGVAAVVYGHPRLTLDIDLVLRLPESDAGRFVELWSEPEFYVPPLEAVAAEAARPAYGHFNLVHVDSSLRADVYIAGSDAVNDWALKHSQSFVLDGVSARVAPVEAVIVGKLRYYKLGGSERHLRDIARILDVSADVIDHNELRRWIGILALEEVWSAARRFPPG
ncbi:MAG: hypothetical protein ACT4OZ_07035 [Gemmatimonadota bacterium]